MNVDFANSSFTAWLNVMRESSSGSSRNFGRFDLTGLVIVNVFNTKGNGPRNYSFVGKFNGPAAQEYGSVFFLSYANATSDILLQGAAVGKKN